MHTKTGACPMRFPTWARTFEAFRSAPHPNTQPSNAALLSAVAALEAAHTRDWLHSDGCAAQAHGLQPDGIWLPLLAATHARL
jgi:hypothetical protein